MVNDSLIEGEAIFSQEIRNVIFVWCLGPHAARDLVGVEAVVGDLVEPDFFDRRLGAFGALGGVQMEIACTLESESSSW